MNEAIALHEGKVMMDPTVDMANGTQAANALVKLVDKAGLAKSFGGEKKHLFYEAWMALGRFYGFTVRTGEAELVEIDGVKGFKSKAHVLDENGTEIGGAEAYCMRDEPNWKTKPMFQLASMSQTRAGSKAFRNLLAFVPALAGFATTPAEEMDGVHDNGGKVNDAPQLNLASEKQLDLIDSILLKRVPDTDGLAYVNDILAPEELETMGDLTKHQARKVFDHFEQMHWTKPREKK